MFSRLPRLPTLVGQFAHTYPLYWDLPLEVGTQILNLVWFGLRLHGTGLLRVAAGLMPAC